MRGMDTVVRAWALRSMKVTKAALTVVTSPHPASRVDQVRNSDRVTDVARRLI